MPISSPPFRYSAIHTPPCYKNENISLRHPESLSAFRCSDLYYFPAKKHFLHENNLTVQLNSFQFSLTVCFLFRIPVHPRFPFTLQITATGHFPWGFPSLAFRLSPPSCLLPGKKSASKFTSLLHSRHLPHPGFHPFARFFLFHRSFSATY